MPKAFRYRAVTFLSKDSSKVTTLQLSKSMMGKDAYHAATKHIRTFVPTARVLVTYDSAYAIDDNGGKFLCWVKLIREKPLTNPPMSKHNLEKAIKDALEIIIEDANAKVLRDFVVELHDRIDVEDGWISGPSLLDFLKEFINDSL